MKNINSNKIKSLIFTLLVGLGLLIPATLAGQEKSEATPLPVGGIKAIAQNVIYPAEAKAAIRPCKRSIDQEAVWYVDI